MASNDYKMRNVPGRAPGPQPSAAEQKLLSTTQAEVPEERPHSMRSSITAREPRKIAKKRNRVQFLLVLFYITLALVSWILLCQMLYKPYGRKSYFEIESDGENPTGGMTEKLRINERYIRAMYIIKTIVTTLTIPVTGYVCMVAAMSYLQSNATKSRLTLKQSMAVADQRWANPLAWAYAGSLPLYVGFFLMLLGVLSQILQSHFIQQETFRTGTPDTRHSTSFIDVLRTRPSVFTSTADKDTPSDYGRYLLQLQNTMASGIGGNLYDQHLWSECEGGSSCDVYMVPGDSASDTREIVYGRRLNYITPLKTNFSSGVHYIPQFSPRINTLLEFDSIPQETFKRECRNETQSGAFYANYVHALQGEQSYAGGFSIGVCITGDLRKSPWNSTRDRQEISETMYFSLVSNTLNPNDRSASSAITSYRKVSAKTTLGYFELPSMSNGYQAGPLQDKDPFTDKTDQFTSINWKRADDNNTAPSPAIAATERNLVNTRYLGPLSSLGLALFDYRSFVGARMRNATSFTEAGEQWNLDNDRNCVAMAPFDEHCAYTEYGEYSVAAGVYEFVRSFDMKGEEWLAQGLNMTNYLFITGKGVDDKRYITVHYDEGFETIRPKISRAGIFVASILLGLLLLGLLVLSVYNSIYSLPTSRLGAEFMVRMGVAHAELLKEAESRKEWEKFVSILPAFAEGTGPSTPMGSRS